ncbi:T9SS type A sorting domain-containing protein [candidate division KSB1 bacterium]|nr:T9SS type A sorting domain-containing protein [candidate division KSB1 bacterium]NIR69809.1 T9SS type A sorting domain-containing protein [candidate division KSB1 bacterium]NIS25799.1 T9SS type A sorting domain-containing protein [candidate division KSB1 bacterium]NIU26488.1 T9SS type A sorting domain-containing protein [candidate division KSB1 bacterium]NIU90866.1 T9SS type A sorting domain-containing protein [candidate division KSB1 bacterium]
MNEVMNFEASDTYDRALFFDGRDTDNSLFFKKARITFVSRKQIKTELRDISEYMLQVKGVEFRLYSLHLKAGGNESDVNQRLREATVLRNHLNDLPSNIRFIVAGDFNVTRSSEPAFVRLTASQADNDGRLFDPLNTVGIWHNNPLFAMLHTQSTRDSVFNHGAAGGLDDRFDMLLVSQNLLEEDTMSILTNSYTAFGNDGRHFNLAINDRVNTAVPESVATALHLASDHLPVFAEFVIDVVSSVESANPDVPAPDFVLHQNFPNPFNAETQITYTLSRSGHIALGIYNVKGEKIHTLVDGFSSEGHHRIVWNGRNDSGHAVGSGVYYYKLEMSGRNVVKKLLLLR